MKKKIAIIGMGGIAQKGHLPVLTAIPGLELFFHSRTEEKVRELADLYRVPKWTTSLEELLSWKPDCAFILTPTPSHNQLASACLEAGIDVFTEKPATESSAETRKLAELADAKKRIAMVAFNRRYAPLSVQAKELWGKRAVTLANFQKSRARPGFKGLPMHVTEELVHVIDILRFFGGEARVLSTNYKLDYHGMVVEVVSVLEYEEGGLAIISASLQAGRWYEHYELNGEAATLNLNVFSDMHFTEMECTQSWKEPYDSTWTSNLFGRGFVGQIEHFLKCVESRQQPQTNLWDCAKTQQLVEEIIAKAE